MIEIAKPPDDSLFGIIAHGASVYQNNIGAR
jgi:hypothetical protein